MIPFVSLGCGRGGSLSKLSLDGLKLPSQVYSAVTPCAEGAGRAEPHRLLSTGPPSDCVTPWPHLAAPLPCIHLFNIAITYSWPQQNESWLIQLQTPLPLIPFSDFNLPHLSSCAQLSLYFLSLQMTCSWPVLALTCCRQKEDRMQCGKCFTRSPSSHSKKHHGIFTCYSTASPENSL